MVPKLMFLMLILFAENLAVENFESLENYQAGIF